MSKCDAGSSECASKGGQRGRTDVGEQNAGNLDMILAGLAGLRRCGTDVRGLEGKNADHPSLNFFGVRYCEQASGCTLTALERVFEHHVLFY